MRVFGVWISTRDGSLSEAELIESVHQRKESRRRLTLMSVLVVAYE